MIVPRAAATRASGIVTVCLVAAALALAFGAARAQVLGAGTGGGVWDSRDGPIVAKIGIEVDQVTSVDQKAENFEVVASVRMRWTDPDLGAALPPGPEQERVFTADAFASFALGAGLTIPAIIYQNQQGPRWDQESFVTVRRNGEAELLERSTVRLQAPHFDFTRYPFDTQTFFIEIASVYPNDRVQLVPWAERSGLGEMLGEEQWILSNAEVVASTVRGLSGEPSALVALKIHAERHLQYYFLRIFVPTIVLILVSWSIFFIEDYGKRIDASSANLLVFIAFNFTISDSLPKLGYLTFLDVVLQCVFIFTGGVAVLNVMLQRLSISGRVDLARKIDNYVVRWIFPLGYGAVVLTAVFRYLIVA